MLSASHIVWSIAESQTFVRWFFWFAGFGQGALDVAAGNLLDSHKAAAELNGHRDQASGILSIGTLSS